MWDRIQHKLFTREDRAGFIHHPHAIIGIFCLTHYLYRLMEYMVYGTTTLESGASTTNLVLLSIHLFLPFTSLVFHVPQNKVRENAIIWKEYQHQQMAFAIRSVVIILACYGMMHYHISIKYQWCIRLCLIMITHGLVDYVTVGPGTLRSAPSAKYFGPTLDRSAKYVLSFAQLKAIDMMIYFPAHEAITPTFLLMFVLHLTSFTMTLQRKQVLMNEQLLYLIYTFNIALIAITISINNASFLYLLPLIDIVYGILRLYYGINKYVVMMSILVGVQILTTLFPIMMTPAVPIRNYMPLDTETNTNSQYT